jgi:hypothetical protein
MKRILLLIAFVSIVSGQQTSPCDLNSDGAVDVLDYRALVIMAFGTCTANINGPGVCTVITARRIINAALDRGCTLSDGSHNATLSWTHSTSEVTGYKIYRSGTSGGPYTLIATIGYVTTYLDQTVAAGTTYYYVATAVTSTGGESAYSNEAIAVIPTP